MIRFIRTGPRSFLEATNATGKLLVSLAVRLARRAWRDGFRYAKAGVVLTELVPETTQQPALWSDVDRGAPGQTLESG